MTRDDRARYDHALRPARRAAYPPGEFVDQESFMSAAEILALATRAGIRPGVSVLDLCCGVAGPGRLITSRLGCSYLGVDVSHGAVTIARERAGHLPCRFAVSRLPPVPSTAGDRYEVVLLLETLLAFPDKAGLLATISSVLEAGGRLVLTVEEGAPLTDAERTVMPHPDTVWPVRLFELFADLEKAGLRVAWVDEWTDRHHATAEALTRAFVADQESIRAQVGHRGLHDLLTAHVLWSRWLGDRRVRKFAVVAEKVTRPT